MKLTVCFLTVLILVLFTSCHIVQGSGNIITEKRSTGDFKGISTSSAIQVAWKNGPVTEVTVETDDNVMSYIETQVSGDVLKIGLKHMYNLSNAHLKVYITSPQINSVNVSSAASFTARDLLKNDGQVKFNASSAGTIHTEVDAPSVHCNASSAASIELSGKTQTYQGDCSSAASLKTGNLLSENATVTASSGANVSVHASIRLIANASSGGSVHYHGGASVNKSESSGGRVVMVE